MTQLTESHQARIENIERKWTEFEAAYERTEVEHQHAVAAIERKFELQTRLRLVLLFLGLVAIIVVALTSNGSPH